MFDPSRTKKWLAVILGAAGAVILGVHTYTCVAPRRELARRQISPSEECQRLQQTIADEVSTGDSDEKLRRFFEAHKWDFDYDERANAYVAGIPVKKEGRMTVHSVIVRVTMDQTGAVKSIRAVDAYLAP